MIFALPPPPGGCDCSGPRSSSTSKQTQCLALEDKEHGGHYSSVSFEGVLNGSGRKTAVFVARLLWFFSEVHRVVDHPEAAAQARGAKHFLLNRLEDRADGGLFETPNRRLSPMSPLAPRTTNTHLHMLEALTLLVRLDVDPEPRIGHC
jgi:mannose/cellobiose epimerase-like protein (N-acyl-D-glucosamine 2-epimerase family)